MIETGLYEILTADTVVTSLVGTRVYPLVAPQRRGGFLAHVVYQRVSHTMDRPLNGPNGLTFDRFQFDCFAARYETAVQIADAVRQALDGFRGDAGGHHIQYISLDGGGETYEFEQDGSEQTIVDSRRDFMVAYAQALAA